MKLDCRGSQLCDPRGTGRSDQKCPPCQAAICKATKGKNNYKAHGPMQTDATRTWRKVVN